MKNLRQLIRSYRNHSSASRVRRTDRQQRRLSTEALERRELLAADALGITELASHNSWNQYDVNNDRAVSARDALGVINYLGRGESEQASDVGTRMFYDVNGDNEITAADALGVINAIGRGEGETDQLIELLLTARTYDGDPGVETDGFDLDLIGPDSTLATDIIGQTIRTVPDANQAIEVNVGEVFELEVSYEDLRSFPNRLGAFQLITDIVANQQGFLQPVLFETQQLVVDQALRDVPIDDRAGTSITLSIPNSPAGRTGDLTYTSTWAQFSGGAPVQVRTAMATFGYLPTDYVLTIPEGVDPDDIAFQIHWTDIAFADVDLPDISIEVNEVTGAADIPATEVAFDPIVVVGSETQFNPDAIPFNLNTKSRSFDDNEPFYTANNDGGFDPATGFTAVKGIGGVPSQGGGIPQLLNELEYPAGPFDAYSLPVRIVQPVTGLQISVRPNADDGDQTEAILIYGEDNRVPITNDTVVIEGPTDVDMSQNGKATIIINAIDPNNTNSDPTVSDPISATFTEDDGSQSVDLLQFSNDVDGDSLTVTNFVVTNDPNNAVSQNGTSASVSTGVYDALNDGASQVIGVTYTLDDGNGGTVAQTATITITGVTDVTNSAPTVSDPISATFTEDDGSQSVDLLQFSNDVDGDSLTVTNFLVTNDPNNAVSQNGTSASVSTGVYDALNDGASQVIGVTYTLNDGNGGTVAQTATITITGVTDVTNSAPTVSDPISATFTEDDGSQSVDLLQFSNDVDGDSLTVTNFLVTNDPNNAVSQNGTSASVSTGVYDALNDGASQVIGVTYTLNDGNGGTVAQTATITITGVTDVTNSAPTVSDPISATFTEDDGSQSVDLLQFSNDVDGDSLTVTNFLVTNDPNNAVSQNGTSASVSTGVYDALNDGASQVIGVTYTLNDGNGGTVAQTATITITGVTDVTNGAPTVSDPISATFTEDDGSQSVDLLQFSNDVDGDSLTVTNFLVTNDPNNAVSQNGTSASVSTGVYDALNDGASQVIGVTYTLNDGNGGTVAQTATITITGVTDFVNTPPVAPALTQSFNEGAATATVNLLANASDVDNDTLSVTNLVRRSGNAVGITAGTSTLLVDPSDYSFLLPGQSTVIIYDYQVSDGTDSVATSATITINGAVDNPPTTGTVAAVTTPKNSGAITIDVLSVANAGGGETQTLSIVSASLANPAAGTLTINGTLAFTPANGFEGDTTINYSISDGTSTVGGTVALSVVDFAPSAIGGSVFIDRIENMLAVIDGAAPFRDGMKDTNEQGLGGVPIKLTGNGMEFTAVTDMNGMYEFTGVAPGTYEVTYQQPDNVIYDGPSTISITIGTAGGVTNGDLNIPLLGLTPGATSAIDVLARTYLNSNGPVAAMSNYGREGAIVSLDDNGKSNFFMVGEGFDGVLFADVRAVNDSDTDVALLTILTESGDVRSAMIPGEQAIASPDGSTVRFFGGIEDFAFQQNGQNVTSYDDFQSAIDQILSDNQ